MSSKAVAAWFAALVAMFLCGCPSKPPAPPNAGPTAPPAKTGPSAAQFLQWAHTALGNIEDQKFADAETDLKRILDARSNDLFATQNLAIARQLALAALDPTRDPARFNAARESTERAISALRQLDPKSAIPWILQASIQEKAGDKSAQIAALRQAVTLEPGNAPAWWKLYVACGGGHLRPDATEKDEALAAGSKVYELQPDNWFFLKDWIPDLAMLRAPELKPVLEQFRTQIEPFGITIERDTRVNPVTLIDRALQALEKDQPVTTVVALRNILLPEVKFDQNRVDKTAFEYLRLDFDPSFYREIGRPEPPSAPPITVQFTTAGMSLPELPGGAARDLAWIDYDVDGRFDLVVLTATHLMALVRLESSSNWQIATAVETKGDYQRLHAADLDDDDAPPQNVSAESQRTAHLADPDVVLTGVDGILVFENKLADGMRSFVPHRDDTPWTDVREVTASLLADLDHDGDLDVFAATTTGVHIYAQRGDFQFFDISNRSLWPPAEVQVTAVAVIDWDRDADLDVIVCTSAGLRWFEDARHGRFRDRPLDDALAQIPAANSLRVQDFDGDGAWDILAAGNAGAVIAWGQQNPSGSGAPGLREVAPIHNRPVTGASVWDYDNDGLWDLVMETPSRVEAFRQQATGGFTLAAGVLPADCTGLARPADVDGDGDLDLWTGVLPVAWRNEGGNANHWLDVRVRALQQKGAASADSRRVNHEGIGSLLELRTGDRYQAALIEGPTTHFGLGPIVQPELLRIIWTNGIPQDVVSPQSDRTLFEEQLPYGSCPYLYTWNGERFVFCTDLLWNAPLGLRFAEDAIAPWREWEYLKIDGKNLQPRDGKYVLQITEELWEVAYFDQVKLFAVDHPADVQIFTNEKVGPAELAAPMIHTVHTPHRPVAARDTQGKDILELVSAADGNYAKTYDRKLASGLVSDHFLELDLGDLRSAKRITLFLTGWMYPTDTSLNVQLSQHPTLPSPKPPALWTPDEQGQWREVRPFLGFIGGKPKTIALDITDAFTPGDYRLRIVTNMEFYWDDVLFTVDEEPLLSPLPHSDGAGTQSAGSRQGEGVRTLRESPLTLTLFPEDGGEGTGKSTLRELRYHSLALVSADLHFRGVSQAVHRPGFGPEWYDYERVNQTPRWPPLSGNMTRYGDVRPLLEHRDDQLAVFAAGDEMTVSFAVPSESLPDGWVRDFVLYNVGWDKDANLNTLYGDAVEPLPFEAMTAYGEVRSSEVGYERYLREYQNRQQNAGEFWTFVRRTSRPEATMPRSRLELR